MKWSISILVLFLCISLSAIPAFAQSSSGLEELETLLDSTRVAEAQVFAPKAYEKADKKFAEAHRAVQLKKKQKSIDKLVGESREFAENALKATEVARLALSEYLGPRDKARQAKAPVHVPDLYQKAEEQFVKATGKVEAGDVKGGLKEADKSTPLFDAAELQAIKVDILGAAEKLINKAVADEAKTFALATLDKARSAYSRCDDILTKDRYNRQESLEAAAMAEYEARHASNIAQSVRSLKRNDQAWEKLMLLYEIEMQKVADALGIDKLPFDNGPIAAAESLSASIKALKDAGQTAEETGSEVVERLRGTFQRMDIIVEGDDPVKLAGALDKAVSDLLTDQEGLAEQLEDRAVKMAELEATHEQVATELGERQLREEKLKDARAILNPTEGTVLTNATDDIVLRLAGLSFVSGSSDIIDEQVPLLEKVERIIGLFPGSKLMVEGHTDDRGERVTNMRLSEKRAFAVMQYLRESMSMSADRISAVGFGPDKPIGTNTTSEGRAKNRRIDIIVFQ